MPPPFYSPYYYGSPGMFFGRPFGGFYGGFQGNGGNTGLEEHFEGHFTLVPLLTIFNRKKEHSSFRRLLLFIEWRLWRC